MLTQSKTNDRPNQNINSSKSENWWEEPFVQYGFNCPSVNVNLERLMGTNVIQMTDPSFMLKLRDRVWNAYDTKLENRIKERQRIENEREVRLVIKGLYTSYNRPQKFKTFHSRALALDLGCPDENQTKYSIQEKLKSPVFGINEQTNEVINKRRLKLTSIRQRNVDRIIKYTKLEGHEPNIEYDELTAIEAKINEIQNKIKEKKGNIR